MLIYAIDCDFNQLEEKFKCLRYDEHYKYYNYNPWINFQVKIQKDSWETIEKVSVDSQGNILGYIKANVNRAANIITSVSAIAFNKDSIVFARDLFKFFGEIAETGLFIKIKFAAITENPANKMYEKIIEKYNGRVVGISKNEALLPDGKYYDETMYEIILKEV